MSYLHTIPLEVLLQITSNLTISELGKLRRTCKHVEASLFSSFSRESFVKKQFVFTEFSLQTLVDISKSRLSSSLRHVIFNLERPWLRKPQHIEADELDATRDSMRSKSHALREEWVSHVTLLDSSQDVELLTTAFSSLDNLQTVGLRDFNSPRSREWPENEWRSYGATTYLNQTGVGLQTPQRMYHHSGPPSSSDQYKYVTRVFLSLLRSLGKANVRPTSFEVILRHTSLYDNAFNLPNYVLPTVLPVLTNLHTLFLDVSLDFVLINNEDFTPKDSESRKRHSRLLREFLSKVTQLKHLRLNFQYYLDPAARDVLLWLSKPITISTTGSDDSNATDTSNLQSLEIGTNSDAIDFPDLQCLEIGMIRVPTKTLLVLIQKFKPSLRTISFHKVTLIGNQTTLQDSENKPNDWADFFRELSKIDNLKLGAINMSSLRQVETGKPSQNVTFKHSVNSDIKKWAGVDVRSGLRDFINDVTVEWPAEVEHETDSDSEMSDVSGDDWNSQMSDDDDE